MRLLESFRRVLVLCAHTDDELACAGTIVRLVESGADVHYVAFSRCEASVPPGLPLDVLEAECRACLSVLGVPTGQVTVGEFEVRYFPRDRQAILEEMVQLARILEPDLVLVPSLFDRHQDHAVVSQEGFRAFKNSSMLGYELPQNLPAFNNSAFVVLNDEHMRRKLTALGEYRSQAFRPYSNEEFIRSLAVVRGVQVRSRYAESFELIRLIAR